MNVLVFLKEVQDSTVRLELDVRTKRLRDDWNVHRLNPADVSALRLALGLKERDPETRITLIHLGPPSGERWLRDGLALGCDEALRIWDEGLDTLRSAGKALIFGRVAEMLVFDLLLTGARSLDGMNGQVGPLVASHLGLPCVTAVLSLSKGPGNNRITAAIRLARGFQERVESALPLVVTVEALGGRASVAPLSSLLDAAKRPIPCLDLAGLGISSALLQRTDNRLRFGPLQQARPRLKPLPAPDSALPAFERISKLVEGVLKPREARVVRKDEAALADEIFQTLLGEGWLDHLRKAQRCPDASTGRNGK